MHTLKTENVVNIQLGQNIELYIERLGINGEGVAHWHGFTVFIEGALPGETVLATLYEKRKQFGRAKLIKQVVSSPHRIDAPCPLFSRCGGCQLMHLEYAQQLETKRERVVDALERIGKIFDVEVLPCEPSPSPLAYRNKIQLPCTSGESTIRLGLYARNTHDLVIVDKCYIHCHLGEKAFQKIQSILQTSSFSAYDQHTGNGELKHVLIKTAVYSGQVLVTIVTKTEGPIFLPMLAQQMMEAVPEIRGVVQNINPAKNNVVLGTQYRTLAGEDFIEEKLLGLCFKVSSASFFQVNPAQAEKLYRKALEFAALTGNETVLDAYCGVGTLSLIFASQAKEVIGVECVPEAIADAQENARRNGIRNVHFACTEAEEWISTFTEIDVAVLNPPRKGCERQFLEKVILLQPRSIVYISCDPATLARDLLFLSSKGYKIDAVQPFDMFPQTAHVECVVRMSLHSTPRAHYESE
ncbi:MAG: 23S rRNA (uracil(1939)-C(5))-methyltransferase RlmD [Simkania sp.]|nr:23S rRNA (uracil(1939)-C(5))-methyltransferase RlmD [Simkania sp.]